MTVGIIFLVLVVFMLVGVFPGWPYSRNWGYGPTSVAGLVVLLLLVLLLAGRL